MKLSEDALYRSSTQFRLWSFTPDALNAQRTKTNAVAAERVRAAVKRRAASNGEAESKSDEGTDEAAQPAAPAKEVECLSLHEEQKLVDYYCFQMIKIGEHAKFPTNVIATGVVFTKRFYLTNSSMTYQPKEIMRSALYLATKTENHHVPAKDFATIFSKTTPEQILAPEYLITQALRFTFDIRHPHRGLNGGLIELLALAKGTGALPPNQVANIEETHRAMLQLPQAAGGEPKTHTSAQMAERVGSASGRASKMLKTGALLSDAYFLYTPSQVWLAAYLIADEPLALFYISTKFPASNETSTTGVSKQRVISTVRSCATVLEQGRITHEAIASHAQNKDSDNHKELVRIEKKLHLCRDPDKMDLVKINKAQKRDAGEGSLVTESVTKRRKLEREGFQKEGNEFWGPELPKAG